MTLKYLLISLAVFVGLVLYNQNQAQKALIETQEAPLGIELVSYPETTKAGNHNTFVWQVNATNDLTTQFTTIYWSTSSSPSAYAKNVSPDSLKFEGHGVEFTSGTFFLPYTFESVVVFDQPQTVYFRAYAKVRDNHLWSEERKITILP